jgi:hypothetical protein
MTLATWEEIEAARLAEVLERQALHRRLLAAREAGVVPEPDDVVAAIDEHASPYRDLDRINARDDY